MNFLSSPSAITCSVLFGNRAVNGMTIQTTEPRGSLPRPSRRQIIMRFRNASFVSLVLLIGLGILVWRCAPMDWSLCEYAKNTTHPATAEKLHQEALRQTHIHLE